MHVAKYLSFKVSELLFKKKNQNWGASRYARWQYLTMSRQFLSYVFFSIYLNLKTYRGNV